MTYPPVIVVDEHDQEVDHQMLAVVWHDGLYHRVVRIMVEDADGNILLQRRNKNMQLYPGRWDNSAAGHVDEGMTYLSAATLEVSEELGLHDAELQEMGYYFAKDTYEGRKVYNFSKVYLVNVPGVRPEIVHEPEEVHEVQWMTKEELSRLIYERPAEVTDGLRQVVQRYY